MRTYYVTVRIETVEEVQADDEQAAMQLACDMFDPTAYDKEVIEIYAIDEE